MIELTVFPQTGGEQSNFENLLIRHFGVKLGAFAINMGNTTQYVNLHIQWMWEQYQQHIRPNEQKPT